MSSWFAPGVEDIRIIEEIETVFLRKPKTDLGIERRKVEFMSLWADLEWNCGKDIRTLVSPYPIGSSYQVVVIPSPFKYD